MKRKTYKAFLIRCWHAEQDDQPNQNEWKFSLEPVDGEGRKQGFTDPQDLLTFLTQQIESGGLAEAYQRTPLNCIIKSLLYWQQQHLNASQQDGTQKDVCFLDDQIDWASKRIGKQ